MFNKRKLIYLIIFLTILLLGVLLFFNQTDVLDSTEKGYDIKSIEKESASTEPSDSSIKNPIQEVATALSIPWEIKFLPDKSLLVTLRTGELVHILPDSQEKIEVEGVVHTGEGGLLGLEIDPNFAENNYIYLYLTTIKNESTVNTVERYTFLEEQNLLLEKVTLIESIPGSSNHDGGRIAFGPDGYLYIATGDAQTEKNAQDKNSLAGKILRITADGAIPSDNPFNNEVYSYGHRNPQGIDWDKNGRLWSSEHGRSIPLSGFDEINLIVKGGNYGWPVIQGDESLDNMIPPIMNSGANQTWAPGDLVIFEDTVIFSGLRGESLYSAKIEGDTLTNLTRHFQSEFGRIRTVTLDPEKKWVYLSTSNTDGRGKAGENDDKIIRILIEALL